MLRWRHRLKNIQEGLQFHLGLALQHSDHIKPRRCGLAQLRPHCALQLAR